MMMAVPRARALGMPSMTRWGKLLVLLLLVVCMLEGLATASSPCTTGEITVSGTGKTSFASPGDWTTESEGFHRVPAQSDIVFVENSLSDVRDVTGRVSRMDTLAVTNGRVVVQDGALFVHRSRPLKVCPTTISSGFQVVIRFAGDEIPTSYGGDVNRYVEELPGQMATFASTVLSSSWGSSLDFWVADVTTGVAGYEVKVYTASEKLANTMVYLSMLDMYAGIPFLAGSTTRPGMCTFRLQVREFVQTSDIATWGDYKNRLPTLLAKDDSSLSVLDFAVLGEQVDTSSAVREIYLLSKAGSNSTECRSVLEDIAEDVNEHHVGTLYNSATDTAIVISDEIQVFTVTLFVNLNENTRYSGIDNLVSTLPNVDLVQELNYQNIPRARFFTNVGVEDNLDDTYQVTLSSYYPMLIRDTETFFTSAKVEKMALYEGIRLYYANTVTVTVDLDKTSFETMAAYLKVGLAELLIRTDTFTTGEEMLLRDRTKFFTLETNEEASSNGTYDFSIKVGVEDDIYSSVTHTLRKLQVNGTFLYLRRSVLCEVIVAERSGFSSIEASLGNLPADVAASNAEWSDSLFAVGNFFLDDASAVSGNAKDEVYWVVLRLSKDLEIEDVRAALVQRSVTGVYWSFAYKIPLHVDLDRTSYETIEEFALGFPGEVVDATFNTQDEFLDYGVLQLITTSDSSEYDFDLGVDEKLFFDMVTAMYEATTGTDVLPKGTSLRWDAYLFTVSVANVDVLNNPFGVNSIEDYVEALAEHLETLLNITSDENLDVDILSAVLEKDEEYTLLLGTNSPERDAALRELINSGYFSGTYKHLRLDVFLDETHYKGHYNDFLRKIPNRFVHFTYSNQDRVEDILVTHYSHEKNSDIYNVTVSCSSKDVYDEVVLVLADRDLHGNQFREKYIGENARVVRPHDGRAVCMRYTIFHTDAAETKNGLSEDKGSADWRVYYASKFPEVLAEGALTLANTEFKASDVHINWFQNSPLSNAGNDIEIQFSMFDPFSVGAVFAFNRDEPQALRNTFGNLATDTGQFKFCKLSLELIFRTTEVSVEYLLDGALAADMSAATRASGDSGDDYVAAGVYEWERPVAPGDSNVEAVWTVWLLTSNPVFMGEALAVMADDSGTGIFFNDNLGANDVLGISLGDGFVSTVVFDVLDDTLTAAKIAEMLMTMLEEEYALTNVGKTDTPYLLVAVLKNPDGTVTVVFESVDSAAHASGDALITAATASDSTLVLVEGTSVETFAAEFAVEQIQAKPVRGGKKKGMSGGEIAALVMGLLIFVVLVVLLVFLYVRKRKKDKEKQLDDAVVKGKYGTDELQEGENAELGGPVHGGIEEAGAETGATDEKDATEGHMPLTLHDSIGEDPAARLAAAKEAHKKKKKKNKKHKKKRTRPTDELAPLPEIKHADKSHHHHHKHKHEHTNGALDTSAAPQPPEVKRPRSNMAAQMGERRATEVKPPSMTFEDDTGGGMMKRLSATKHHHHHHHHHAKNHYKEGYEVGKASDYAARHGKHKKHRMSAEGQLPNQPAAHHHHRGSKNKTLPNQPAAHHHHRGSKNKSTRHSATISAPVHLDDDSPYESPVIEEAELSLEVDSDDIVEIL